MRFSELARLLLPLSKERRALLQRCAPHCSPRELRHLRFLLKTGRAGSYLTGYDTRLVKEHHWPQFNLATDDPAAKTLLERLNKKIENAEQLALFQRFARKPHIPFAPHIIGLDAAKRAAAVQLFATEPLHILLLGDPGTGKTELLRSSEQLAPKAVFGLGSGASKAGLIGMYDGKTFRPGLLVQADEGLALIDELNLLKKDDLAGLYSAMEKGFVTIDKQGQHDRFDARVSILATANPKGDSFIGKDLRFLKTQLPFSTALLSRFHLVFTIRKPRLRELKQIAKGIVRHTTPRLTDGDKAFIRDYVAFARRLNVTLDPKHESLIVEFIERLKQQEKDYLLEVGPRTVIGVIRLAKAFARMRLARKTSSKDLHDAQALIEESFALHTTPSGASSPGATPR